MKDEVTNQALNSQLIEEILQQAVKHHQADEYDAAIALYKSILEKQCDHYNALQLCAMALGQSGQYSQSLVMFQSAYAIDPTRHALLSNYTLLLQKMGKYDESLHYSNEMISLYPATPSGYLSYSANLRSLHRIKDAVIFLHKSLEKLPDDLNLKTEYALCLHYNDQGHEAMSIIKQVIDKQPNDPEIWSRIAMVYEGQGFYRKGCDAYENSLRLRPNHALTLFNYSLLLILIGRYELGWKNYELRSHSVAVTQDSSLLEIFKQMKAVVWNGVDDLNQKSIVVITEQGFGDMIHFLRYLPILKSMGAKVFLLLRPHYFSLESLVKDGGLVDEVVKLNEPIPHPNYQCAMMSLAYLLKDKQGWFPPPVAMKVNSDVLIFWQNKIIQHFKHKFKQDNQDTLQNKRRVIGFVMEGSGNIKSRETQIEDWLDLFSLPNFDWICLQQKISSKTQRYFDENPQIFYAGNDLKNFSDTAALIEMCDHVISIDTAVAHLAGTQGQTKKTDFLMLILPHLPTFRWGLRQIRTGWYPCAKVYRQIQQGDWKPVFAKIYKELLE